MTILDGITKLMNEHGSANILRERILLAKDQEAAQEKRILDLESQAKQSEAEKAALRLALKENQTINQNHARRIQELEAKIRKYEEKPVTPRIRIECDDADFSNFSNII